MPQYKDKRNGKWKYRTYACDAFGNRKQYEKTGFDTKRDAKIAEEKFKQENVSGIKNMTFNDLWEEYRKYKELKLKPQSFRSIKSRFKSHILPYFKDIKLIKINSTIYLKWQSEIEKKGFKHKYNSGLHGAMVNILNYAVKFHGLKQNVASLTGNFKRKTELTTNVDFWTYEEYEQFISVIDDDIYRVFFETLYYTGLRQGEALALNWKDLENGYLNINKTIAKEKDMDGKNIINTPKTSKSIRKVKLDDELIDNLNKLKDYYKRQEGFSENWFIFGGLVPLAPSTIGRKKDNYCKIANVKKIRIHDFRHSHASLLLSMNVPITVISQRLGHSDINMTLNTYSHMIPKDEDKAVGQLNQMKQNK